MKNFRFNKAHKAPPSSPVATSLQPDESAVLPEPILVQPYQMPTSLRIKLGFYIFFMCFITFLLGIILTIFLQFHVLSGPLEIIQRPVLALSHIPPEAHKQWLDFNEAVLDADKYFYDRQKIDYTKIYYAAAESALQTLSDDYTFFEPPKFAQQINDQLNGHLGGGIGVEVSLKQHQLTLSDVYPGNPAAKAGLQIGDIILKVNGQDLAHTGDDTKDLNQDSQMLKGDINTPVTLTIQRPSDNNRSFEVVVTRGSIQRPLIETKLLPGNIGYIKVKDAFGEKTPEEFNTQVQQLVNQGASKFVLDVRDNGGGLVEAAKSLLGHFLPNGPAFYENAWNGQKIVQTVSDVTPAQTLKLYNQPLVVLVNKSSASASEITAGALQSRGRATLIGDQTFGKGVAQYVIPLEDGAAARVTYAHWLTPTKQDINHNGLTPNISVPITADDSQAGRDPQLDKAVQFLQNGGKGP